ncbi:peptidoglycan endopeptidase LytE [Bacillus tianshenii]|uniref:Peptidoglycan endopeptidase LytE n=1 Tax=Sutcliffiella tianshenii TaxID=1463404 RepID=A0ABS2NZE9_9BACI|nr:C40 family peptidase [Bacillus tianshenii]MBM7619853.1 peptidoglycan endopeptidase LytE [Bacillus tianshenii]
MLADKIIQTGKEYLGTPYVFGAPSNRKDIFDCSSFVQRVYGQHGIKLPRSSRKQFQVGRPIPLSCIREGDLLFFTTPMRRKKKWHERIGHVAIYLGNHTILHTSQSDRKVSITILSPYLEHMIVGARRVIT